MSYIVQAVTSYPQHVVKQSAVHHLLTSLWPDKKESIYRIEDNHSIESRNFSLPLNYYCDLEDVGKRNVIWKAEACRLQKENIQKILDEEKIDIADIGLIASATTSGLAVPSLEALMMNQFPFCPLTKRLPLFGLGCLGGVAGINRVNDYLRGHPKKAALLMVTELSSLNFQMADDSLTNLIGTTSYGDGSGAVLLVGDEHPLAEAALFEIMSSESVFYPETERLMGLDMVQSGFQLVISSDIPSLIKARVGKSIEEFLGKNKITKKDINFYMAHPGGSSIMNALCEAMMIEREQMALSWESWSQYGDASAASIINVIEKTSTAENVTRNNLGLMIALGPAFSLELSLLKKC